MQHFKLPPVEAQEMVAENGLFNEKQRLRTLSLLFLFGKIDRTPIHKRDAKLEVAYSFQWKFDLTSGVKTENVPKMAKLSITIKAFQILMVMTPHSVCFNYKEAFKPWKRPTAYSKALIGKNFWNQLSLSFSLVFTLKVNVLPLTVKLWTPKIIAPLVYKTVQSCPRIMNTIALPIRLSYAWANLSVKATVKYGISRFPGEKRAFFSWKA